MKRIVLMAAAAALSAAPVAAQPAPIADHHQHLFSPAIAAELARTTPGFHTITASDVIALLDSAGIRRALLLSVAYIYGSPSRSFDDEYGKVRGKRLECCAGRSVSGSLDRILRLQSAKGLRAGGARALRQKSKSATRHQASLRQLRRAAGESGARNAAAQNIPRGEHASHGNRC